MRLVKYLLVCCLALIQFSVYSTSFSNACSGIQLQVLGSGGPEIDDGLASSSYLIWINGKARIMVDAGGGSSLNFEKSGAHFNDLEVILLTHLHVDHSAALPVYVKAGYFTHRDQALLLLGPAAGGGFPSTEDFTKALLGNNQVSVYPYLSDNLASSSHEPNSKEQFLIVPESVDAGNKIWERRINDQIKLSAIQVLHGTIPALAWRVDMGTCSVSFSGDMNASSGNLEKLAFKTDLLVAHNAIGQEAGKVAKFLHMTPRQIGKIAAKAKAKNLIISHFMNRTRTIKPQTLRQIRADYDASIRMAEDLMLIPL